MEHIFHLSDEQYAKLAAYAARRKQTPESLFQSWLKAVTQNAEKPSSTGSAKLANAENEGLTETEKILRDSPLLRVSGMFAIGEEGWADRHDEYLGEIYLENHADEE